MTNFDKLFDSTAFLLSQNDKSMNYTKLIKELYFSDRESIKQTGLPITGDTYYSMKEGVVLSSLLDLIKGNYKDSQIQNKWNSIFCKKGYNLQLTDESFSRKSLSKRDKIILTNYSEMFKGMDWKEVVDNFAHNPEFCPEWKNAKRLRLPIEDICKSLNFSEEAIKITSEEYKYYFQNA